LQAWRESPTDLGSLFAPIIAKGLSTDRKPWIDFERERQTRRRAAWRAFFRVWQGQEIREFTSCVCDVESLPFCKAIAAVGGERPTEPSFFLSRGAKENANQIHLPTNT
jgi:hypothetical protein